MVRGQDNPTLFVALFLLLWQLWPLPGLIYNTIGLENEFSPLNAKPLRLGMKTPWAGDENGFEWVAELLLLSSAQATEGK